MFLSSVRELLHRVPRHRGHREAKPTRGPSFKPRLEAFEDRLLLSVDFWTGAVDSFWSTPGNWRGGAAPGPDDIAMFDNTALNLNAIEDTAGTVARIDAMWKDGTLTLARDLTISKAVDIKAGTFTVLPKVSMFTPSLKVEAQITISGSGFFGTVSVQGGTVKVGQTGATVNILGDGFINNGSMRVVFGAGVTVGGNLTVNTATLENAGTINAGGMKVTNSTVNLINGTLNVGSYTQTGGALSLGSFTLVVCQPGPYTLNHCAVFTEFTVAAPATLQCPNVTLTECTADFAGNFNCEGDLNFHGGGCNIGPGVVLDCSGNLSLDHCTLNNGGICKVGGDSSANNSSIMTAANSMWLCGSDLNLHDSNLLSAGRIEARSFSLIGGVLTNVGSCNVAGDCIGVGCDVRSGSGAAFTCGGNLNLSHCTAEFDLLRFDSFDVIDSQVFELTTGDGTVFTIDKNGKVTVAPNGRLNCRQGIVQGGSELLDNGQVTTQLLSLRDNGLLSGSGQVIGNVVNDGQITLSSRFTIDGNYTQTDNGVLKLVVGNNAQFGLFVTGTARLGGTLDVSFMNGFMPSPGQYQLIHSGGGIVGTFGEVKVPPGSLVVYTPMAVDLVVQ